MKAIGVGAGLLAFLALATAAEAQINIEGIKPDRVVENESATTYQATVTGVSSGCYFKLCVLLGISLKFDPASYWVSGTAPFTISHGVTGMNTWGMQGGQVVDFRGKAWTNLINKDTHDLIRIVEDYYGFVPASDRRSSPSGVKGELYAAVLKEEEELLA